MAWRPFRIVEKSDKTSRSISKKYLKLFFKTLKILLLVGDQHKIEIMLQALNARVENLLLFTLSAMVSEITANFEFKVM